MQQSEQAKQAVLKSLAAFHNLVSGLFCALSGGAAKGSCPCMLTIICNVALCMVSKTETSFFTVWPAPPVVPGS